MTATSSATHLPLDFMAGEGIRKRPVSIRFRQGVSADAMARTVAAWNLALARYIQEGVAFLDDDPHTTHLGGMAWDTFGIYADDKAWDSLQPWIEDFARLVQGNGVDGFVAPEEEVAKQVSDTTVAYL